MGEKYSGSTTIGGIMKPTASRFVTFTQTGWMPAPATSTPSTSRASPTVSAATATVTLPSVTACARFSTPAMSSGRGWKLAQPATTTNAAANQGFHACLRTSLRKDLRPLLARHLALQLEAVSGSSAAGTAPVSARSCFSFGWMSPSRASYLCTRPSRVVEGGLPLLHGLARRVLGALDDIAQLRSARSRRHILLDRPLTWSSAATRASCPTSRDIQREKGDQHG